MAIKISQLTSLAAMTDAAVVPVVSSGVTYQISGSNLKTYFSSVTGNITGGNLNTGGLVTATGNVNTAAGVLATGNVRGGNVTSVALVQGVTVSATGNITGGNIITGGAISASGLISATGTITSGANIIGSFFVGNGSALTGIAASYGNANVAANLAAFGSNPILTTGNVTAGNFVGGGAGTPTLSSATNLDLSAVSAVRVIGGGTFRLPSLTTAQIANTIAANGDMIYNSSINKFQGYENSAWANII
jgi:hypothetical protein